MALTIFLSFILLTGSTQMSSVSRKKDTTNEITNVKTDIVFESNKNEYDTSYVQPISIEETSASCELPACQGLGKEICTDANYKKFVVENCCKTCADFLNNGVVTTMAIPETSAGTDKAPVVCVDKSASCAALGLDICTNPLYHTYVVANCAGHCKLCEGGITVPTTVTPKTTSSIPTTKIITARATTAAACVDTIPDCDFYSINDCVSYPQWAKSSCQRYCNLCPKNCEDKIDNCAQFGSFVCTNYKDYAANNCAKYCNLCPGDIQTTPTVAQVSQSGNLASTQQPQNGCVDKLSNCRNFDASVCVTPKYAQWAKENCARKCNMCDKGCYYNGTLFKEGAQIQDGCKFVCICHDGNTGRYGCTSLCFEYTLPSECTLLPPKPGKCCKTPSCPDNIHLNTTGGNLIG